MLKGLTTEEAEQRLKQFGRNVLPVEKPTSIFFIFFRQFLNPLIYILLAAAIVSYFLGEYYDALFILIVLLINATIGTILESSAQKQALSLRKIIPNFSIVLRDGERVHLDSEDVVPGDVVFLEAGDRVPVDLQLFRANNLSIDESLLTGESQSVQKIVKADAVGEVDESSLADMAFSGTTVMRGRGQGVVVATGIHTKLGGIAKAVTTESVVKPPLLQRIEKLTMVITYAALGLIALLSTVSLIQGTPIKEVFFISVALAVSALPEGLPSAITVTLAIGMRRMAASNVIIRKLLAVESLGSCTFIASDKTGTLTVNKLTVRRIILPDNLHFDVTGEGLKTTGEILSAKNSITNEEGLQRLCRAGVLTNEAFVKDDEFFGDSVDIALLILGKKTGLESKALLDQYPLVASVPYESEKSFSASINKHDGTYRVSVKGSAEKLLQMCTKMRTCDGEVPVDAQAIISQMQQLAEQGYRVLALAEGISTEPHTAEEYLTELTFLGLVGMIDPLCSEARESVALCRNAGIEVAMITGDHPITARTIAKDLGIYVEGTPVVTGMEIEEASAQGLQALDKLVQNNRIFARIQPLQKQEIVESFMRQGHFVALTGDGVNDAPALKHSHIGIAMGRRGTNIARESADLILTDDDFSSIVKGIREGRIVYNNIRKVIFLLISTGAAEIIMFLLSIFSKLPMPLLPVQLLWLNLVTNGVQDVALAFEPAEGDELSRPPRAPNERIFNRIMIQRVLVGAAVMGSLAFLTFQWLLSHGHSVESARNVTLLLMVLCENAYALNSRSETRSIFSKSFFKNPLLLLSIVIAQAIHVGSMYLPGISTVLEISPISFEEWDALVVLALSLILAEEIHKVFIRRKKMH